MLLKEIVAYLDEFLDVNAIDDSCKNGLEIGGKEEIKKGGFAVDACLESAQKAALAKCDLLVVHHGLFWESIGALTDLLYKRIKEMIKNDIALYAAHLPLDIHPKVGNNVQLANLLDLSVDKTFCDYKGHDIGVICENKTNFDEILDRFRRHFPVRYIKCTDTAEKVGIITGSGGRGIPEAVEKGCDTFITGELRYQEYRMIDEYEINIICGGHYATEQGGVKALMDHLQKKFPIECEFLDLKEIEWTMKK